MLIKEHNVIPSPRFNIHTTIYDDDTIIIMKIMIVIVIDNRFLPLHLKISYNQFVNMNVKL